MIDWNIIFGFIIQGIFIGIGISLGMWLSNRRIVKTLEKFEGFLEKVIKKQGYEIKEDEKS